MPKVKLTAGRIAGFKCDESKAQAFLWCSEVPGLGVRVTPNSTVKGYIFQSKVAGKSMRVTIGNVNVWSIPEAQAEARRLQILIDNGNDPREVKADKDAAKKAAKLAKEAEAAALILQEARESVTVMCQHFPGHMVKQLCAAIRSLLGTNSYWRNAIAPGCKKFQYIRTQPA
jgi:hypothetical protein